MRMDDNKKYYMPAEYDKHRACLMIWPVRPGSWPHGAVEARKAFAEIARAIAKSEKLYMCVLDDEMKHEVSSLFMEDENIEVITVPTNDAWARDVGPTCVYDDNKELHGISWRFNAWGGDFDGLYADYELDDKAAKSMCEFLGINCIDAGDFVLEGGSIHSDGDGTLMVTETCLLSRGRNPELSREEIENTLKYYLGCEKILWLPRGIDGDETNEHVDNICAFVKPGEVVLAWTDDVNDQQYEASQACYEYLSNARDARGRHITIHKLPIPKTNVCITKEELEGFVFEEGEDIREVGERLAASYVNFYISNEGIILPQFGDENDSLAVEIVSKLYPDRTVYPIYARPIIVGGGNIHCITQQIPL